MRETLKMMRELITGYEKDKTIEELLQEYKQSQSPNILAYLFVNNYGVISTISTGYKLLDTQDIASCSLQELDNAIFQYDNTKECSFITFFVACLKNRLRSEQQLLQTDLRFANYCADSIYDHLELEDTNFELTSFNLKDYGLSHREQQHVNLLLDGYSIPEVAKMLGVTKQGAYYRNKIIGKKLLKAL